MDHLSGSAYKFQWLSAVIGRIKLGTIIKGTSVMGTAGLSDIRTFKIRHMCATTSAASTAVSATGMFFFSRSFFCCCFFMLSTAGMTFFVVMVTICTCRFQFSCKIGIHCRIYFSCCTGYNFDTGFFQRFLCTFSDTATDQNICTLLRKESCKRTVSGATSMNNLHGSDLSVFYLIHFKSFCLSEVLENRSAFVCYCYFHL